MTNFVLLNNTQVLEDRNPPPPSIPYPEVSRPLGLYSNFSLNYLFTPRLADEVSNLVVLYLNGLFLKKTQKCYSIILNYILLKDDVTLHWRKLEILSLREFKPGLVKICLVILESKNKMFKVYNNNAYDENDEKKAVLSPRIKYEH